jgi:NAD(P)-dependent dehydrogenase (short-subunit alcohol dehydrogenase family)
MYKGFDLSGKVAVLTGSTAGMGFAIARGTQIDKDGGEGAILAERAQAILQVLMELLDHSGAAGVAGLLARLFHSAE